MHNSGSRAFTSEMGNVHGMHLRADRNSGLSMGELKPHAPRKILKSFSSVAEFPRHTIPQIQPKEW